MSRIANLATVERIAVLFTVGVGWTVSVRQLLYDGWIPGGGTGWLLAFCVVATLGAVTALFAQTRGNHGWAALALLLVTASPAVFAYVLNVLVLALAAVELGLGLEQRFRGRRAAGHQGNRPLGANLHK